MENLTSTVDGNMFVGVMSKSTNLPKITLLVSMEILSHGISNKIEETQ